MAAPDAPPDTLVTFVIPSIGRATLARSLESLAVQTDQGFAAVLVMDGVPVPEGLPRYPWLEVVANVRRAGVHNHAGAVRNPAIARVRTEWVGFLDDDDTLGSDYVRCLREEAAREPRSDAVVFRMRTNRSGRHQLVLPPPGAKDLFLGRVGISFAVRARPPCLGGAPLAFRPSHREDYDALDELKRRGGLIVIHPRVLYFVRSSPSDVSEYETGVPVTVGRVR